VPGDAELRQRLPAVLTVVYLVFNEGYSAASGDALVRKELCAEALRLGHALVSLLPNEPEVLGLAALMEIQASRARARVSDDGEMILFADQDRSLWDREAIERGMALLAAAARAELRGSYTIQAQIAACHARAPASSSTDWTAIAGLYRDLFEVEPSPVVQMNRAVAVSFAEGPEEGLRLLEPLLEDPQLARYHLLPAVRADMLRRRGLRKEAAREYERAIVLCNNEREVSFLRKRLRELS
jgi:predicted RNA polymerase sigma factor